MKRKILQLIADSIIDSLSFTKNINQIDAYYTLGTWFNNFCINNFDIYLE